MNILEWQAAISLACIYFLRMFSLFLILPVLSLYAEDFSASATLIGIALGIYGLTQAVLQIPLGALSDRWGRKKVITLGLVIFAIGGVIAGSTESIYMIIIGRALQGSGAIAAAIMALAADLSRESQRAKVMALIGISIGGAFLLAFLSGPIFAAQIGIDGLFFLSSLFAVLAILILYLLVPNPNQKIQPKTLILSDVLRLFQNHRLILLNISIFLLHMILTANFVVIPIAFRDFAGLNLADHWHIYLPVLIFSGLMIAPFLRSNNEPNQFLFRLIAAIFLLTISQFYLSLWHQNSLQLMIGLGLFFTAFNYMEAILPAQISRLIPIRQRGTAFGLYSSCQFLGTFFGGVIGGKLFQQFDIQTMLLFFSGTGVLWLLIMATCSRVFFLFKEKD